MKQNHTFINISHFGRRLLTEESRCFLANKQVPNWQISTRLTDVACLRTHSYDYLHSETQIDLQSLQKWEHIKSFLQTKLDTISFQQCIEHIHNLSISNIKRLFQVLLLMSAARKGSGTKCEIDEIINRFLISVSEREKFLGILALLMKIQVEMNKK